jgi:hypothetical protein
LTPAARRIDGVIRPEQRHQRAATDPGQQADHQQHAPEHEQHNSFGHRVSGAW